MKKSSIVVLSLILSVGIIGCGKGPQAQKGSNLSIEYSLSSDQGELVPSSAPQSINLVVGQGLMPQAFEEALVGLSVGQVKKITLSPDRAYGDYNQSLIGRVPKSQFQAGTELKEGSIIGSGAVRARVVKVLEDEVVLDRNHPLAGRTLTYKVKVNEIN